MDHIPILVIGRVAIFSDSDSLVLLSCCSKWLQYCISQQNNFWYQRYKQYYNLADDNEIKWLAWYVKIVRAPKLFASQIKKTINIARLHNQHIKWFHAFCYRRATEANWLKDTPYPVKDLMEKKLNNIQYIVLQRIAHRDSDLRRCFIVEQCQPIGEISTKRFWHLRRLFLGNASYELYVKQCLISDRFVVTISRQTNSPGYVNVKPSIISVWPVSRVSIMQPRQFSCLCNNTDIRGRWMIVDHSEIVVKEMPWLGSLTTTRVFDLANSQMCMGTIKTHQGETFLLRVTEEAATVFSRTLHHSDTTTTFRWNVWEFSNRYLGYGPRCLMQGEIRFKKYDDSAIPVKKLDDNRLLIENNSQSAFDMWNENSADEISLAMISTDCSYSSICIKDAKPIWTLNGSFYGTVPLFGSNRILVMSGKGWTVHSLIDGVILAHIDVRNLISTLEHHRSLSMSVYIRRFSLYRGRCALYESISDGTFIAVDLIHPSRTRNLGKTNSEYLYKQALQSRNIIVRFDHLINYSLLLNDIFDTRNAMLMVDGKDYKIIDVSF
ncbi:hypothetical protein BDF19DRAFT_424020 [Syncephalis fuscata]|nr:hypothetical protein BDF19DRAFT_424020 [Syncephalis fuscata]